MRGSRERLLVVHPLDHGNGTHHRRTRSRGDHKQTEHVVGAHAVERQRQHRGVGRGVGRSVVYARRLERARRERVHGDAMLVHHAAHADAPFRHAPVYARHNGVEHAIGVVQRRAVAAGAQLHIGIEQVLHQRRIGGRRQSGQGTRTVAKRMCHVQNDRHGCT
jgi:hypothetical protein